MWISALFRHPYNIDRFSTSCIGVRKKIPYRRVKSNAFTLLELLVVLAIMGALLSVTSVFYRADDTKEAYLQTSQSLRIFLQHKIGNTWLDGVTYGLQVTSQKIEIYELKLDDNSWQKTAYSWQVEEEGVQIYLIDNRSGDETYSNESSIDNTSLDAINELIAHNKNEEDSAEDSGEDNEEDSEEDNEEMNIVFMSSGEYTPFSIRIESAKSDQLNNRYILQGDGVNALQVVED